LSKMAGCLSRGPSSRLPIVPFRYFFPYDISIDREEIVLYCSFFFLDLIEDFFPRFCPPLFSHPSITTLTKERVKKPISRQISEIGIEPAPYAPSSAFPPFQSERLCLLTVPHSLEACFRVVCRKQRIKENGGPPPPKQQQSPHTKRCGPFIPLPSYLLPSSWRNLEVRSDVLPLELSQSLTLIGNQ